MGSCTGKFDIPQNARYFAGDLGESSSIPAGKYKSISSKKYAGTNTFEDITHENAPVGGDIYYHFNSSKAHAARTTPSISAPDEIQVEYGLNPYETKQDEYHRARTDNLAYNRHQYPNRQQSQMSNRQQGSMNRSHNGAIQAEINDEREIDYSRLFNQSVHEQQPSIKITESRFL